MLKKENLYKSQKQELHCNFIIPSTQTAKPHKLKKPAPYFPGSTLSKTNGTTATL